MHILTGMIVAALMGKGKSKPQSVLHGRTSPVRLSHSIPGRSRFHVSSLKAAFSKCESLADRLKKVEGISDVWTDPRTGSVTIFHDPVNLKPDLLAAALIRLLGLEGQLKSSPQPALVREVRRVGGALNSAVYDKSAGLIDLWSLVPLAFIVLGIRKLMTDRASIMPTGVTMLWWGYNSLFKGNSGGQ